MRSLRSHTWLTRETGPTANLQSTRSHAAAESDELTPPTKQPISPSLEIPNPEGRVGSPRSLLFLLRPLRPFERSLFLEAVDRGRGQQAGTGTMKGDRHR
ncbi:hypothetical protein MUK42_07344 [Musa troglodytarum]|nr:hypothetical protein MUK42_07344 [Musa troglodytarum]